MARIGFARRSASDGRALNAWPGTAIVSLGEPVANAAPLITAPRTVSSEAPRKPTSQPPDRAFFL